MFFTFVPFMEVPTMSHPKTLNGYPYYFYTLLMYEGFALCEGNLRILHEIEQQAFMNAYMGDGYVNYHSVERMMFEFIQTDEKGLRSALTPAKKTDNADVTYVVMAVRSNFPVYLQNPKLDFKGAKKAGFMQKIAYSFRMNNAYKWAGFIGNKSLVTSPTALTILDDLKRFESKLFWGHASGFKVVAIPSPLAFKLLHE